MTELLDLSGKASGTDSRYGMVVDLNRCVGCQTCTAACKHANDTTPDVQWRRVLDLEFGQYPDVQRLFLVTGCQHCADPPCVPVCPTGATFAREDGVVAMTYDDCIGCGYCAVACPYQARTIVHEKRSYFGTTTIQEASVDQPDRLGVAQKCTFCIERLDEAAESDLTPGVDPQVTPACSSSCIAQAIHFGDLADPDSNVSELLAENQTSNMHSGLGTDPQIHYLVETPAVSSRSHVDSEPAPGPLQKFWDIRATANFFFGGMSSGFAIMAFVAYLAGEISGRSLTLAYVGAALVMSIGLFAVFLEIGRKSRALFALKKITTSWMTREIWAAIAFFALLAADFVFNHVVLHLATAIAAATFLYCQARILHAARGIVAWRVAEIPAMLVAGGLLEGTGLLAVASGWFPQLFTTSHVCAVAGIVLSCLCFGLWAAYASRARTLKDDDFYLDIRENHFAKPTRDAINAVKWPVHIVGHVLPVLAIIAGYFSKAQPHWLWIAGGCFAIAGGLIWKSTVITRASHQQGFSLPSIPARGSGRRAAGARFDVPRIQEQAR